MKRGHQRKTYCFDEETEARDFWDSLEEWRRYEFDMDRDGELYEITFYDDIPSVFSY